MTEEQKQKYLESPNHCPNCGSDNIWSNGIDGDGRMAFTVVTCEECDSSWHEVYTLTDMTEFVKGGTNDNITASSTVPAGEQVPDSPKGAAPADTEVPSGYVQPEGAGEDPAADWERKHGGGTTSDIDDWWDRTQPGSFSSP